MASSTVAGSTPAERRSAPAWLAQADLWLFAITLAASAFLLFAVQPLFAKLSLPKLGGAPAVWAVSLCFFQAVLLAGYAYAHALNRFVPPRIAVFVHVALLLATLLALPIALPTRLGEPPAGDAYLWLTGVLALGVGLPFFALSAHAPLLQAWYARSDSTGARDPYFLYGASNIGSLLALLAYPFLVEPALGVATQTRLWSIGFALLAVLIAACGMVLILRHAPHDALESTPLATAESALAAPPSWAECALWVLLSAIPSGLMIAVTTFITTDVSSAPFVWVVPLALFLTTFILVFRPTVWRGFPWLGAALPVLVMLQFIPSRLALPAALLAFFVAALICHRELYLRRPGVRHLTAFYLWMSLGGVLGGMFAALLAPHLFTSTLEYQLLMVAALLCMPGVIFGNPATIDLKRVAGIVCLIAACLCARALVGDYGSFAAQKNAASAIIIAIMLTLFLTRAWAEQRIFFVLAVGVTWLVLPDQLRPNYAERSFFGTVRVEETLDRTQRLMVHGTTIHGARRIRTPEGLPVAEPVPATYYHERGPMARGFALARNAKARRSNGDTRLISGVVGLGSGALACFAQPGDGLRFFEIDPVVVKVARNPTHFDFLSTCAPQAPMIVGDARLTLAKEPDDAFDYLVLDAFSSNSVPVHLLTEEALRMYLSKLSETGVLALHLTNRYMDLVDAVSATLARIDGAQGVLVRFERPADAPDAYSNLVVMVSRNAGVIEELASWPDAGGLPRSNARAWTDDYANIPAAMWKQLTK